MSDLFSDTTKAIGACVLGIATLFGGGWAAWHWRGISAGVVHSKAFYPAHYETRWHWQYVGSDSKGRTQYISVPYQVWVPDRWTITIHGKNGSGVEVSSQLTVPQNEYNTIRVGEMYGTEATRTPEEPRQ